MTRTKTTRNPQGSIIKKTVVVNGKKAVRYDARKRYTKLDGTTEEKFKRCRSDKEAQIALTNFHTEIADELAGETGPVTHTFFELCDYFEKEFIKPPIYSGERQVGGYRQNLSGLRGYVTQYKAALGNRDVTRITYEDVRKYALAIATTPVTPVKGSKATSLRYPKPSTLNRKLAYLRRIFNVGIQLGWLDRNPFGAGKRLIDAQAEEARERVLSLEEEERLLSACEGSDTYAYERKGKVVNVKKDINPRLHLRPAIILAIESGMRKREMFTTIGSQVDFEKMVIELNARQTKALRKRFIPMSDRLAAELRKLFATLQVGPKDLIFGGAKSFDRAFSTACKRTGIEDLTFHDLRHSAASRMDEAGISDAARRNALGHGSVKIGMRYVHPTPAVLESSRVKMNEFRERLEAKQLSDKNEKAASG